MICLNYYKMLQKEEYRVLKLIYETCSSLRSFKITPNASGLPSVGVLVSVSLAGQPDKETKFSLNDNESRHTGSVAKCAGG